MGLILQNGPKIPSLRPHLESGQRRFRPEGSSFSMEDDRESARVAVAIDIVSKECFGVVPSIINDFSLGAHNQ